MWEHRMAPHHSPLCALCQAITGFSFPQRAMKSEKARPGKRFYEAWEMEFVFQLQLTEHRAKRLPEVAGTLKHTSFPLYHFLSLSSL